MKRFLLATSLVLALSATAKSQSASKPDLQNFELTPTAPPTPALKYQLLFDDAFDSQPGNAAYLYFDAMLLADADTRDKANKALEAYDSKRTSRFDSLADSLQNASLFEELTLAAERDECEWQSPFREMGFRTLLPHLSGLRDMSRILKVRALRQVDQGKIDDALKTICLDYEMSEKVGREPTLVSGLVSLNIASMMDDCLSQLMNRSDSPNLYWAISELPSHRSALRKALDGERMWETASVSDLAKADPRNDLSADQWRAAFDYLQAAIQSGAPSTAHPTRFDPVGHTSPELMQRAQDQYAQKHQMTPDQAAKVDPIIVIGEFYYQQFRITSDDLYKLRGLPYPLMLSKSKMQADQFTKMLRDQPQNLFLQVLPAVHKAIWSFARVDRHRAALAAVEAIRSYAAQNSGALPAHLEDITDTPVPLNPATDQPFEYKLDGDIATLSDSHSEAGLTFTIKIRK